jgi:hypothetical protein
LGYAPPSHARQMGCCRSRQHMKVNMLYSLRNSAKSSTYVIPNSRGRQLHKALGDRGFAIAS